MRLLSLDHIIANVIGRAGYWAAVDALATVTPVVSMMIVMTVPVNAIVDAVCAMVHSTSGEVGSARSISRIEWSAAVSSA